MGQVLAPLLPFVATTDRMTISLVSWVFQAIHITRVLLIMGCGCSSNETQISLPPSEAFLETIRPYGLRALNKLKYCVAQFQVRS